MIPKFILTHRHYCAIVKSRSGDLALTIDRGGRLIVSLSRPCIGDYIKLQPYLRISPSSEVIKPFMVYDYEYVPIYVIYRDVVALNQLTISGGKVSLQSEDADETVLRGLVVNNEDYVRYMIDVLISKYLESPIPILAMSAKLSNNPDKVEEQVRALTDGDYHVAGVKIYHKPGFMVSIRRISPYRVNVALMCSIDLVDDFKGLTKALLLTSTIVHDLRLGRVGELPMGMDVFYPIARRSLNNAA
ncbi:hypothetical protein [Caldivirga sp. UBA161]|uniref:hypothetical protein n=1 Tax=Caldivirga sp. UBA161 TaxID=1915569 RepID=UPI0025BCBD49|nr:hypothetical protein [Caldivirga sp. UBA161]